MNLLKLKPKDPTICSRLIEYDNIISKHTTTSAIFSLKPVTCIMEIKCLVANSEIEHAINPNLHFCLFAIHAAKKQLAVSKEIDIYLTFGFSFLIVLNQAVNKLEAKIDKRKKNAEMH